MSREELTIAYLTAGAAGMYCGSCLHDNTLAKALIKLGCDVHLIPTYTPIRTDEEDVSDRRVFFGGINVYLQQQFWPFRFLPAFLDRWLDRPWLINWLASRGIETDARHLGALAVSILRGENGNQRKEVRRLVDWLEQGVRPDIVNLSNVLIGGCIPMMKRRLRAPILVTLQGDDIFLDSLIEPYRSQSLEQIRLIGEAVDGFLVYSRYYADHMSAYLGLPLEKFQLLPLGIQTDEFNAGPVVRQGPPTVGFLARVCPEKGFHVLVSAFERLRTMPGTQDARLRVAGWLGKRDQQYFEAHMKRLRDAGFGPDIVHYAGTIDRAQKVDFLRSLDVLSVPTTYREPKGLFVLEALASGIPVVVPAHGAFPEMLAQTGGGLLVPPNDIDQLAATLHELLTDRTRRQHLASAGQAAVHERFNSTAMAQRTLDVYRGFLPATSREDLKIREPSIRPARAFRSDRET